MADSFDWRDHQGILTPVRDQKECNCCWSTATGGVVESIYNIELRRRNPQEQRSVQAAPQYLIDHVKTNPTKTDVKGCYKLSIIKALNWILENNGMPREEDYPFRGKRQVDLIKEVPEQKLKLKIKKVKPLKDYSTLDQMIRRHPIAGAIRITKELIENETDIYYGPKDANQLYKKGNLHAILIVGFGKEGNEKFWVIKNSWSANWGDNGYKKISQNLIVLDGFRSKYLLERLSYPVIFEENK